MAHFQITPDHNAASLGLDAIQTAVYEHLCSQRQTTSAQLISLYAVQNPEATIATINARLLALNSSWQILISTPRAPLRGPTQSMRTPVAYYRLSRKTRLNIAHF